ncbi:MAG TPA: hypothetical protein VFJ02_22310 [Vicinamibacterales bacterium]|nr:hypothetical protein [Vicinamibacterales bacterium]
MRIIRCSALAVVFAAQATAALGQAPPERNVPPRPASQAAPAGDPASDSLSDADLAAALDAYALVQAQQWLSIADDKYRVFAARLKRLQDVRRRNQRIRHRLVMELRKLVGNRAAPGADDAAIKAQLTALRDHDDRSALELRQAYDALDEVLDPRQQARFRLFEEQIELRKLDLMMRARERAQQNRK